MSVENVLERVLKENFDCDGNCVVEVDCYGVCGGDTIVDDCGVCGGNNMDMDECGECFGIGPEENFDCDGNCVVEVDCYGVCGGDTIADDCGVCDGNNDDMDECDVCFGDNSTCTDECGIINGPGLTVCNVSTFNGYSLDCECFEVAPYDDQIIYIENMQDNFSGYCTQMTKPGCFDDFCSSDFGDWCSVECNNATLSDMDDLVEDYQTITQFCDCDYNLEDECGECGGNGDCDELSNDNVVISNSFDIANIYPNPFNPTTTITYQIPEFASVSIDIYNLNGQLVESLYKGFKNPGEHFINWNASNITSGTYLVTMTSGSFVETQKVMLLK